MGRKSRKRISGVLLALAMVVGLAFAMNMTAYADDSASYKVQVASAEHGKVAAWSTSAAEGEGVKLTAAPDDGYVLKSLTATYREAITEEIDASVSLDITYPASEHFKSECRSRATPLGWVINTDPGFEFNSLQISRKGAYSKQDYTITSIELTDSKATGKPSLDRLTPSPWTENQVATDDGRVIYNYNNGNTSYFVLVNGAYESRTFSKAVIHALAPSKSTAIEGAGNTREFTMPAGDVTITAVFAQQATGTAPAANSNLTYNSEAQELVTAGSSSGGTMQYALGNESGATGSYSTSIPKATDAGDYYVWYKVVGDESHVDSAPASVPVTIGKANPTAEAPTNVVATYGQTLADVTLVNPASNTPGTWAWAEAETTPVGGARASRTHAANFTPTDTANYNNMEDVNVSVTVRPQEVTPPVIVEKPFIGTDKPNQTADVTETDLYKVTENIGGKEVGEYPVKLTLKDPANYIWADVEGAKYEDVTIDETSGQTTYSNATIILKFRVEKAPAPIAMPVTYDPNKTLKDVPLLCADGWDWKWVEPDTVPQVNNEGYKVILENVDDETYNLTGVEGYNPTDHSVTWTIPLEVAKAYLVEPTISSKTYNGKAQTADVADTDRYTVTTNNGGTDVGSYDVVLTLNDSDNYAWLSGEGETKTLTFQITKAEAPVVVAPTVEPVKYDAIKTLKDVALPEGWAWTEPEVIPPVGEQSYDAALTVDDANYDYTNVEGYDAETHKVTRTVALTVSKGDFTPTITLKGWTYGEKPNTPTVTGNPSDGEVLIAYAPRDDLDRYTLEPPAEPGDYTVGVYIYPTDNYNEAWAMADFTIAKEPISSIEITDIAAPEPNATLDTKAATGTAGITLGGVTWSPSAKTAAYATVYKATVKAAPDSSRTFAANVSATVNGKPATVSKNADGTLDISYTFDKTELMPTIIAGGKWAVVYSESGIPISLEDMFIMPAGAGKASYKVIPVTGEGTFANGKLTVTKCGTFTVQVNTLASATHKAASATATLIVGKNNPSVSTATKALVYNGKAQKLMQAGSTTGGTLQYALGTSATKAPNASAYSTSIPTATAAKTYYVWHKVVGDANYNDSKPVCTKVTIAKAANALTVKTAAKSVKASKKAQTVKCITKAKPKFKAKVTYKKATSAKAKKLNGYKKKVLSVNKDTGKITVKKNAKPGTYKLMVTVTAAKTANTKAASKTVTVTVKVKAKAKAAKSLKAQSAQLAGVLSAARIG